MLTQAIQHNQTEATRTYLLYALESGPYEIYVFGAQTLRFEYLNYTALRNIGYTLEAARKMTPLDLTPEFTEVTFRENISPLLRHEKTTHVFHVAHRRADGSFYPAKVYLQL